MSAARTARAAFGLGLLLCATLASGAPSPVGIRPAAFSPTRRFPGDVVEALFEFDPAGAAADAGKLVFPKPDAGRRDPVELVDAELKRSGGVWRCRLRFRVWEAGSLEVPGFQVGALAFPAQRVQVESALEAFGREAPLPAPQRDLPGTRLLIWGGAGLLLLSALIAAALFFRVLPRIRALLAEWRSGRSRRELESALSWLSGRGAGTDPAAAYALLAARARSWLADACGPSIVSLTAREFALARPEGLPEASRVELSALFTRGEALRFAGGQAGDDEVARACAGLKVALAAFEEARRAGLR